MLTCITQVMAQSQGWFRCLPLLSQPTRRLYGGLLLRADAEKKNQVSHDDWIYCNWVFTSTTDRTEGKYNFVGVMGWRNRKKINQQWSNSGPRLGGPLSASVTRRMRDPECCRDCKHRRGRGTAVIQRKYRSSEVNKSIVILITDRNVYWWVMAKRWFS